MKTQQSTIIEQSYNPIIHYKSDYNEFEIDKIPFENGTFKLIIDNLYEATTQKTLLDFKKQIKAYKVYKKDIKDLIDCEDNYCSKDDLYFRTGELIEILETFEFTGEISVLYFTYGLVGVQVLHYTKGRLQETYYYFDRRLDGYEDNIRGKVYSFHHDYEDERVEKKDSEIAKYKGISSFCEDNITIDYKQLESNHLITKEQKDFLIKVYGYNIFNLKANWLKKFKSFHKGQNIVNIKDVIRKYTLDRKYSNNGYLDFIFTVYNISGQVCYYHETNQDVFMVRTFHKGKVISEIL
jgi:hypothetical protein